MKRREFFASLAAGAACGGLLGLGKPPMICCNVRPKLPGPQRKALIEAVQAIWRGYGIPPAQTLEMTTDRVWLLCDGLT